MTRFRSDEGASIATWAAVAAFPLMMAVTYAIDLQGASRQRAQIENAADSAVLAAALHGGLSAAEKEAFAEAQFNEAFPGDPDTLMSVTPSSSEARVTLDVKARFPTSLSFFSQKSDPTVRVVRVAETTTQDTVCLLSMNRSARAAIEFAGDVQFNAPTCSVHTNSTHASAIVNRSSRVPIANAFCATGGTNGAYSPSANGECSPIEDPYALTAPPEATACEPELRFRNVAGMSLNPLEPTGPNPLTTTTIQLPAIGMGAADPLRVPLDAGDSSNVVTNLTMLTPGTYCGGLTIAGRDVRMLPGEYVMKDGPFVVKDGATVEAQGVLVALSGTNARLKVEDLGSIVISAPKVGPRAGIAFMEDTAALPGGAPMLSTIHDGAIEVTGTVYLPSHRFEIKGGASNITAQAPATSFIVDTVRIMGSGTMTVSVDHVSGGIPAIQPRSDEGARLVR